MKNLLVLCFMVAAVTCQPVGDASSLTNYLTEAQGRFDDNLVNNPDTIITLTLTDLGAALGIANALIMNNVITLEEGATTLIDEGFTYAMNAASQSSSYAEFNQLTCGTNRFPFPDDFLAAFEELTTELNTRVPKLCNSLGY